MMGFVSRGEYLRLEARVEALETALRAAIGGAAAKAGPEDEKARRERELAAQWDNFWAYDGRPQGCERGDPK